MILIFYLTFVSPAFSNSFQGKYVCIVPDEKLIYKSLPNCDSPGAEEAKLDRLDQWGLRNQPSLSNNTREKILVLGDSNLYGNSNLDNPVYAMQSELNATMKGKSPLLFNAGMMGYSLVQSWIWQNELVESIKPKKVIYEVSLKANFVSTWHHHLVGNRDSRGLVTNFLGYNTFGILPKWAQQYNLVRNNLANLAIFFRTIDLWWKMLVMNKNEDLCGIYLRYLDALAEELKKKQIGFYITSVEDKETLSFLPENWGKPEWIAQRFSVRKIASVDKELACLDRLKKYPNFIDASQEFRQLMKESVEPIRAGNHLSNIGFALHGKALAHGYLSHMGKQN